LIDCGRLPIVFIAIYLELIEQKERYTVEADVRVYLYQTSDHIAVVSLVKDVILIVVCLVIRTISKEGSVVYYP